MIDLTAEQLNNLIAPLWERERELRPTRIYWNTHVDATTQLCESSMVRWLMLEGVGPAEYLTDYGCKVTISLGDDIVDFTAPTLVESLAAANAAVLDANEKRGEP